MIKYSLSPPKPTHLSSKVWNWLSQVALCSDNTVQHWGAWLWFRDFLQLTGPWCREGATFWITYSTLETSRPTLGDKCFVNSNKWELSKAQQRWFLLFFKDQPWFRWSSERKLQLSLPCSSWPLTPIILPSLLFIFFFRLSCFFLCEALRTTPLRSTARAHARGLISSPRSERDVNELNEGLARPSLRWRRFTARRAATQTRCSVSVCEYC